MNWISSKNLRATSSSSRRAERLLCALLCCLFFSQQCIYASITGDTSTNSSSEFQAADVLQIRTEVDRLVRLEQETGDSSSTSAEVLSLRAFILRKIFLGFLDVRRACNKVDIELAYTNGILQREQSKRGDVNLLLNQLNFAQFSALYTIEPYLRINDQFKASAILTCVGAGLGTALPVFGILYNKYTKAHNTAPPKFLAKVLDGGPVDGSGMPPTVERFLNAPKPGEQVSRREAMYELWKKRYGVDASKESSLCSLEGGSGKSLGLLNTRIVLLYSLYVSIEDFDHDLQSLLQMVLSHSRIDSKTGAGLGSLNMNAGSIECARLLNIEPAVEELIHLNRQNPDSNRQRELDLYVMENVLSGMLDMRVATDKIDGELNYAYDVVLSSLLARRGRALQKNYEANFIQTGIFGGIAGLLFLKDYSKAGNTMFIIQGGIGATLSALALWQMRGGSRKIDTPPNSLAQFLNPDPQNQYHFSPLISRFLDSPSPASKEGKSRREFLIARWKERRVSTVKLQSKEEQEKLAAMPPTQRDTITIVRNRIDLMHSLKARLEEFDSELLALVEATNPFEPKHDGACGAHTTSSLTPAAAGVANILGFHLSADQSVGDQNSENKQAYKSATLQQKICITRTLLSATLEARKAADDIDLQIATETTAKDRIVRIRDLAINLTNNANFFQISILGIISDGPLGLSADPRLNLYGNRLNIVSAYLTGALTGATLIEQHGGLRLTKAEPNALGSALGIKTANDYQFSSTISKFLNAVAPTSLDGLTRKEELIKYWKTTKVTSVDVERRSTQEKLAANGPSHHFWSETIKLLNNRIRMLYDLKAVTDLIDVGLSDLVRALD